jgi:uncharacterized protein with WD repeat
VRVVVDDDAREKAEAAVVPWMREELGPEIEERAKRYVPIDTGALRESIEHHMNGTTLVVSATGSDVRTYAAYIELGHRVYHPSTGTVGPEWVPAQPFLRPALYGGSAHLRAKAFREDAVMQERKVADKAAGRRSKWEARRERDRDAQARLTDEDRAERAAKWRTEQAERAARRERELANYERSMEILAERNAATEKFRIEQEKRYIEKWEREHPGHPGGPVPF